MAENQPQLTGTQEGLDALRGVKPSPQESLPPSLTLKQRVENLYKSPLNLDEEQRQIFPTADGELFWQLIRYGKEPKKGTNDVFRGYLQVDKEDIPTAVQIMHELAQKRITEGKPTNFKWLLSKLPPDSNMGDWLESVGDYSFLEEDGPRIAIYADTSPEVREVLKSLSQDPRWVEIEEKRKTSPRRPGTNAEDEGGKEWRSLNYNDKPGYSEDEAADPNWRNIKAGTPTIGLKDRQITEPQPLTPEQQAEKWVIDKIGRENAKVEAGQKPKWGEKPDALVEFLKFHGIPKSRIMKWGSTRCFDEAAKILGLERKSLPRAEAPGAEELEQLQERLDNLEQRVNQLEAENKILKEENELLKKALTNPDTLIEEEKTRLAELKGEAPPIEKVEEEAEVEAEEATPPEKPEKTGFIAKAKNFWHNWWRSVSPQGRNKWCWGFGVAVGALEQLGLRPLLTPIIGPAAGWAVHGVNAFAIQAVNYRLQKGITEAKANGDNERVRQIESRHSKFSDVVAGIAAGSFGAAIGSAIWEGFVAPKLPTAPSEVLAAQPMPPVEGVTPPVEGIAPPAETVTPSLTPGPEVVTPPITPPPVEKLIEYTVRPGDTISEILARMGHDPYGSDLTKLILDNAELLASKGEEYTKAVELVKAHPDWIARGGGTETWRIIMQAARLIHPGDLLKIP